MRAFSRPPASPQWNGRGPLAFSGHQQEPRPLRSVAPLLHPALVAGGCTERSDDPGAVVLARVDGEPIRAAALAGTALGASDPTVRRQALEQQIERLLLAKAAREKNIRGSDEEAERALERLRSEYPPEQFEATLRSEGLDLEQMRERLRETLLVQRRLVEVGVARGAITDEEIEAWGEENGDELAEPEQVRAAQIVVRTEEEAERIRERLEEGESFDELAKAESLSPDGKIGGDLGFFGREDMPPPFGEVCFALEPGEISEVVSSPYGFHVFQLIERRQASVPEPEEMRVEAARQLRRQKEAQAQQALLARLRGAAKIEIDDAALSRLQDGK